MSETEWDETGPDDVPDTDVGDDADVPDTGLEPTGDDTP